MQAPPLIERALTHATSWLEPFMPVLAQGSFAVALRRALERERLGEPLDPLAEECAAEVPRLLEQTPPDVFAAYVAIEVSAAREPEIFGPTYRLFREFVMRSVLGAARKSGIEANVAETTLRHRWVGRGDAPWTARLVDGRLWIDLPDGSQQILDPDLGMSEDFDA
ncbi:hypothetical protein ACNOYE_20455 [Nannocystaceae bacterium ST9]